jgi:hypothetical protein
MHFPIPLPSFLDVDEYRIFEQSTIVYIKITQSIANNFNYTEPSMELLKVRAAVRGPRSFCSLPYLGEER